LRLLPDYPEVHNNLGNMLMRQGRLTEAEEHFQEALQQMPEYAQAHNNLGILRQHQGLTNEALLAFQKAVEYDTNYLEAHFNIATAYQRMNQREKCIAELRETLRINPDFEVGQRALAKALGQGTNPVLFAPQQ
jgi:tetratricopeptide (TPR) repeat protein